MSQFEKRKSWELSFCKRILKRKRKEESNKENKKEDDKKKENEKEDGKKKENKEDEDDNFLGEKKST